MKDPFKGKVNKEGVELAPDWVAMGLNPITGMREHGGDMKSYHEKRRRYMKEYYQAKKRVGLCK